MNYRLFEDVCRAPLQPMEKFVLLYLACRSGRDGLCYPSQGKVARDTGLHRNTVIKAMASLVRCGALREVSRDGKAVTYKVELSGQDMHTTCAEVHTTSAPPCTPQVQGVHTWSEKSAHHVCRDPNYQGTINEPPERTGGWGATLLSEVKARDPGATPEAVAFLETRMPELLAGYGIVNGTAERVLGAMADKWVRTGVRPYDQLKAEAASLGQAKNPAALLAHRLTKR